MFDFHLIRNLPRPKMSFLFLVIFFTGFCLYFCCYRPLISCPNNDLHGAVNEYITSEQGKSPKRPRILIAGSSLSGFGFHIEELEKITGVSAAKIALDSGTARDVLDVLRCFPNECSSCNFLFLEIAPQRIRTEQELFRRNIFLRIQNPSLYGVWQSCRSPFSKIVKGLRKKTFHYYENHWYNLNWTREILNCRPELRKTADEVRKNRSEFCGVCFCDKNPEEITYSEHQIAAVHGLMDLCRQRGIFVVICITPEWYGQLNLTQHNLQKTSDDRYIQLLQELNRRPDSSVIICRDFAEITNEGTDEDYLFDFGHMTEKGAKVYTNWLVDQLLKSPKTAEALHGNSRIR